MELSVQELTRLLHEAAVRGAEAFAIRQGLIKDDMNQVEAIRLVKGRYHLKSLENKGLVHPVKTSDSRNAKVTYSRRELLDALKIEAETKRNKHILKSNPIKK